MPKETIIRPTISTEFIGPPTKKQYNKQLEKTKKSAKKEIRLKKNRDKNRRYSDRKQTALRQNYSIGRFFSVTFLIIIMFFVSSVMFTTKIEETKFIVGNKEYTRYQINVDESLVIGDRALSFVSSIFISVGEIGESVKSIFVNSNGTFNNFVFVAFSDVILFFFDFGTLVLRSVEKVVQGIDKILDAFGISEVSDEVVYNSYSTTIKGDSLVHLCWLPRTIIDEKHTSSCSKKQWSTAGEVFTEWTCISSCTCILCKLYHANH